MRVIDRATSLILLEAAIALAGCGAPPVERGSMPIARHEHRTVVLGGRIYVIGGLSGGEDVARVDAFDPASGTFTRLADLLDARSFGGAAVLDGRIYAISGTVGTACERYDTASGRWERIADLPAPRTHFAAAAHDGRVFAIGGFAGVAEQFSGNVWAFDPRRGAWEAGPPLPLALHGHRAVEVGGRLHVLGGTLDFDDFTHHFVLSGDAWEKRAPLPKGQLFFVAVEHGGAIVAAGGLGTEVWRYDPRTDAWSRLPDHAGPARYHADGAVARDRLYLFGGAPTEETIPRSFDSIPLR